MKINRTKTLAGLTAAALAAVAGLTSTASAQLLLAPNTGQLKFNIEGVAMGTFYRGTTGGNLANPAAGAAALDSAPRTQARGSVSGEDTWGLFKVTSIVDKGNSDAIVWSPGTTGQEVRGMVYGVKDYFYSTSTDFFGNSLTNYVGSGLMVDLYLNDVGGFSRPFNGAGSVISSGASLPAVGLGGARTSVNTYTGVTEGTLLLRADARAGYFGGLLSQAEYVAQTFNNNTNGTTYGDVVGGSAAGLFDTNAIVGATGVTPANQADLFATFTSTILATTNNPGRWAVSLNGSIDANLPPMTPIPEPSTYGLMAAGALVGFVAIRRRMQKKV